MFALDLIQVWSQCTLPFIKEELSLNLTQLSEIAGIVFFGALISKFISGPLMNLSRKNVLAEAFLFTVSMVLMMFSNTYITLCYQCFYKEYQ